MESNKGHETTVTTTCRELMRIAECSYRMTDYADPDDSLLITIFRGQDGTRVRLVLDRQCVTGNWRRFGLIRVFRKNVLPAATKQIRRCFFVWKKVKKDETGAACRRSVQR